MNERNPSSHRKTALDFLSDVSRCERWYSRTCPLSSLADASLFPAPTPLAHPNDHLLQGTRRHAHTNASFFALPKPRVALLGVFPNMHPHHTGFSAQPQNTPFSEHPPPPIPMALQPHQPKYHPPEPAPSEPPSNSGVYVYPHTPFPYFPSRVEQESRRSATSPTDTSPTQSKKGQRIESEDLVSRPTHVTILIPSAHLPASLPSVFRPCLWGGASPAPPQDPWSGYYNAPTSRCICTDNSALALCALHAGRITLMGLRRARVTGFGLALRISLHRGVGKYVGGLNAFVDGGVWEGATNRLESASNNLPIHAVYLDAINFFLLFFAFGFFYVAVARPVG
jgi:hypothetical protein